MNQKVIVLSEFLIKMFDVLKKYNSLGLIYVDKYEP